MWPEKHTAFVVINISVQSLSRVWLFATPWIAACQASPSITNSQSILKLMPIKSVIYCPWIEDVSDIKLIRTDTTLDLSQKAEKRLIFRYV